MGWIGDKNGVARETHYLALVIIPLPLGLFSGNAHCQRCAARTVNFAITSLFSAETPLVSARAALGWDPYSSSDSERLLASTVLSAK